MSNNTTGTLEQKKTNFKFNTIVFRKDKFGIILKAIICTLQIQVLWSRKSGPRPKKGGYETMRLGLIINSRVSQSCYRYKGINVNII